MKFATVCIQTQARAFSLFLILLILFPSRELVASSITREETVTRVFPRYSGG